VSCAASHNRDRKQRRHQASSAASAARDEGQSDSSTPATQINQRAPPSAVLGLSDRNSPGCSSSTHQRERVGPPGAPPLAARGRAPARQPPARPHRRCRCWCATPEEPPVAARAVGPATAAHLLPTDPDSAAGAGQDNDSAGHARALHRPRRYGADSIPMDAAYRLCHPRSLTGRPSKDSIRSAAASSSLCERSESARAAARS
jgi:hypothetical protein